MEFLLLLLKISIVGAYLFFFLKGCKKGFLLEGIVIASVYPTVATMIGQESGKTLVSLFLYFIIIFLALQQKKKNPLDKKLGKKLFGITIVLLFLYLLQSVLMSPAMGYDYYTEKIIFSLVEIFIPCFLIIIFGFLTNNNIKFLFKFFEVIALLAAILLLVNAYSIGIGSILASEFMTRVAVGDANVIWTGRFLSIGFLLALLTNKKKVIKMVELLIFMFAMILTGSKAVVLFSLLALVFYALFLNRTNFKKHSIKLIALIAIVVTGFTIFISYFNPQAVERRFSFESGTIDARQGLIEKVFEQFMITDRIVFGNGFATAGYPLVGNYDKVSYPHNVTVEVLYELGFVGLLLYYLPLLIPFYIYKKKKLKNKETSIMAAIFTMFILYAQTSGNIVGNALLFILAGYLVINMSSINQNFPRPRVK